MNLGDNLAVEVSQIDAEAQLPILLPADDHRMDPVAGFDWFDDAFLLKTVQFSADLVSNRVRKPVELVSRWHCTRTENDPVLVVTDGRQ